MEDYIDYSLKEIRDFDPGFPALDPTEGLEFDQFIKISRNHFKSKIKEAEEDIGEPIDESGVDFIVNGEMALIDYLIGKQVDYSDGYIKIEDVNLECTRIDSEFLYFEVQIEYCNIEI